MKNLILVIMMLLSSSPVSNRLKLEEPSMVLVEGGTFEMGGNSGAKNQQPARKVTLQSFYIGKYEVTQKLWNEVMETNPSGFNGCDECPVEQITWQQIQIFLDRLNEQTGRHYRLPTEAEWEYAAMGGNKSKGYKYSGSDKLEEVAWYKSNAGKKTHPVGQKKPNELGIYDMSGNVWEICSDWFDGNYYKNGPVTNPRNDRKTFHKVVRGGSWLSAEDRCQDKARFRDIHDHFGKQNGGFRLVLDK